MLLFSATMSSCRLKVCHLSCPACRPAEGDPLLSFALVRETAGTSQTERKGVLYSAPSFTVVGNPYDLSGLVDKRFDHRFT
jgi:hypothetical protein